VSLISALCENVSIIETQKTEFFAQKQAGIRRIFPVILWQLFCNLRFLLFSIVHSVMKSLHEIQQQFAREEIEFSDHAVKQMLKRGISVDEIFDALQSAECIEAYPEDKYGASVLVLGFTSAQRPLHIVVTAYERPLCKIITTYQPNPDEWEFYRIRRPML
jgi:hypothetical protein